MNSYIKKICNITIMMICCMMFFGCGKSGNDVKEVAGLYKVLEFVQDGEEIEGFKELFEHGVFIYFELNEDGTGCMNTAGNKTSFTWDNKELKFGENSVDKVQYVYNSGIINGDTDHYKIILQKCNDEEVSYYNKTGGEVDYDALVSSMAEAEGIYLNDNNKEDVTSGESDPEEAGEAQVSDVTDAEEDQSERPFFLPDLSSGPHDDQGFYEIDTYEESGAVYTQDDLYNAGITFDMMLKSDGTGYAHFLGEKYELSWLDGMIVVAVDDDTQELSYSVADNGGTKQITITDDISTMTFDYIKEADDTGSGSVKAEASAEAGNDSSEDFASSTSAEADGSANEDSDAAKTPAPAGVPNGDGLVSDEELQKFYVWLDKVKTGIFQTTYEEVVDFVGVDGEFDKEEYVDSTKENRRYYLWTAKDNEYHTVYINFAEIEDKPGTFRVVGFNSSGFSSTEAADKYLEEVKAMEADKSRDAAANATMKEFSVTIETWNNKGEPVTFITEIPESGWSYDEGNKYLVEADDPKTWGAGFMKFQVAEDLEFFDKYKDKWENYQDIDDRVIGGVTMKGRTYKSTGYDWTQYVGTLDDGRAISIGMVRLDTSEGTMTDKILNSMSFK